MQRSISHSITKFDSRQSSASQPGTQVSDWFREANDNQEIWWSLPESLTTTSSSDHSTATTWEQHRLSCRKKGSFWDQSLPSFRHCAYKVVALRHPKIQTQPTPARLMQQKGRTGASRTKALSAFSHQQFSDLLRLTFVCSSGLL